MKNKHKAEPREPRIATLGRVRVPIEKLVKTLKENRKAHKKEFEAATEGYWDALGSEIADLLEQTIESMRRNMKRAEEQDPQTRLAWASRQVSIQKPTDHTGDFDRAIGLLEWDTAEHVDLSCQEFDRYVLNKWDWIKEHITSITSFAPSLLPNYK